MDLSSSVHLCNIYSRNILVRMAYNLVEATHEEDGTWEGRRKHVGQIHKMTQESDGMPSDGEIVWVRKAPNGG